MGEALYMEYTSIPPERTAAQIKAALVKAGAHKIMEEYAGGEISTIIFAIQSDGTDLPFRLPIRIDPIFKLLNGRRKYRRSYGAPGDLAQAKRVAWRQVYRWVQAQVALSQTGMVSVAEVFFPYLMNSAGHTLYEVAASRQFKALPYYENGK
jgi:hypothetical protein